MPSTFELPMSKSSLFKFDVAIIGAGPAGLSAAITLGRARRRVVVFDHGKPRNHAARAVHCFLGLDGLSPWELRERGRNEASAYGVTFVDAEVTAARCLTKDRSELTAFAVATEERETHVRSLLLATGMIDQLPSIPGLKEAYGTVVHHCPYCDGFEHRDQSLVALGSAESAPKLGATLLGWSSQVTVCTNGRPLAEGARFRLARLGIAYRDERIHELVGESKMIRFEDGTSASCEALFFSSDQSQKSTLPQMLGCECDGEGLMVTRGKQCTNICGVYLAGDADGDVQFSVVAAAEGAIAATAINQDLLDQDQAG
jgi:thioredoxin reductase